MIRYLLFLSFITFSCYGQTDSIQHKMLITKDTYNTRWLTIGVNYEFVNSVFGFQLSNGVDEEPLIHFEDFQDNFLIKIHGQSNFNGSYSYGAEFGLYQLRYIGRTTIQFNKFNLVHSNLYLTDINLTSRVRYIHNTGIIFRMGYQQLKQNENFGIGLGLEQDLGFIYLGLNSRYYFDYYHHEAYFQLRLPCKRNLTSIRAVYSRIDDNNLFLFGLNYSFVRNKNH